MGFDVGIYASGTSWAMRTEGRSGLEDRLDGFFGDAGDCVGAGTSLVDGGWDLAYQVEGTVEEWLPKLLGFLRAWGVPPDTELVVTTDEELEAGAEGRKMPVYPTPDRPLTREELLADPLGNVWTLGVAPAWVGEAFAADKRFHDAAVAALAWSIDEADDLSLAGGWRDLLAAGLSPGQAADLVGHLARRFESKPGSWRRDLADAFPGCPTLPPFTDEDD
jgi:hypothetical protein